jgi:hypothetical protein
VSATDLMVWGLVVHLICDWPLQNEWMALNKMKLDPKPHRTVRVGGRRLFVELEFGPSPLRRHPAAYVHAGIHGVGMLFVFPWWAALAVALTHLLIDLRWPVERWSRLMRQTQPGGNHALTSGRVTITREHLIAAPDAARFDFTGPTAPLYDIGTDVRIWNDQVFHIAVIAIFALVVGA